jgi:hypothetical protein
MMLFASAEIATKCKGLALSRHAWVFNLHRLPVVGMRVLINVVAQCSVSVVADSIVEITLTESLITREKMGVTLAQARAERVARLCH